MMMANEAVNEITLSPSEQLMFLATEFNGKLSRSKNGSVNWYPYSSMSNIQHLCHILPNETVERLLAGTLD